MKKMTRCWTLPPIFMAFVALWPLVEGEGHSHVALPRVYTAMKGDIPVKFSMNETGLYIAMVHLWYIPGSRWSPKAKWIPVASLAVPSMVTDGTVVFPCGAVIRAGPHVAVLSVDGEDVATSSVLNVQWPKVKLVVPTRLETYNSNVKVVARFTTNLCSQMLAKEGSQQPTASSLPFRVFTELVKCSNTLPMGRSDPGDCQAPTSLEDTRVWFLQEMRNIYTQSSWVIQVDCSVWGSEGVFRVFLRTNLTHMGIIARSKPITVVTNTEYNLGVMDFGSIYPCPNQDVRPVTVTRPQCAPESDKVRAYGQGKEIILGNVISPKKREYLGEVRVAKGESIAIFPCEFFTKRRDYWRFCFDYVTRSVIGTMATTTQFCLPANLMGKFTETNTIHFFPGTNWKGH